MLELVIKLKFNNGTTLTNHVKKIQQNVSQVAIQSLTDEIYAIYQPKFGHSPLASVEIKPVPAKTQKKYQKKADSQPTTPPVHRQIHLELPVSFANFASQKTQTIAKKQQAFLTEHIADPQLVDTVVISLLLEQLFFNSGLLIEEKEMTFKDYNPLVEMIFSLDHWSAQMIAAFKKLKAFIKTSHYNQWKRELSAKLRIIRGEFLDSQGSYEDNGPSAETDSNDNQPQDDGPFPSTT